MGLQLGIADPAFAADDHGHFSVSCGLVVVSRLKSSLQARSMLTSSVP
jgi:hypothetical protein